MAKQKRGNPYAICVRTKQGVQDRTGQTWSEAKFKRCVKHVKKNLKSRGIKYK